MNFIAYTNIWIALAAGSQVWLSYFLLGKEINYPVVLFVFCSTIFIYNFLRVIKSKNIPSENYSLQMKWVNAHLKLITFIMMIGFVGATSLFFFLSNHQKLIMMAGGIIAIGYNLPFAQSSYTLRKIPFLKSTFISAVWVFSTYSIVESESNFQFNLQEFLIRFLFIYALTIPFDIRDLKYDDGKMKTTPQLVGITGSVILGIILMITCLCVSFDLYDNKTALLFTISYFLTVVTLLLSIKYRSDLYCLMIVDGMIILQAFLIISFGN